MAPDLVRGLEDLSKNILDHFFEWGISTLPGRIVLAVIGLAIVLPRLGGIIRYVGKAVVIFTPLILVVVSAFLLENPRTFDPASGACRTASASLPAAASLGPGVRGEAVHPVSIALRADTADTAWLDRYWAVRCALVQSFQDGDASISVGVIDFATAAQSSARVQPVQARVSAGGPGSVHALQGPSPQADGTTAAGIEFASGRLFVDMQVRLPEQGPAAVERAHTMLLADAETVEEGLPLAPELDGRRPFRDHLARVWAAWVAVLALLPGVLLMFLDADRLALLVERLMVYGVEVLRLSKSGRRLIDDDGAAPPGKSLVVRIRAARLTRGLSTLASVAVWSGALLLLVRALPAHFPLWVTSAFLGAAYLGCEVLRMTVLATLRRFRYLRPASASEALRRLSGGVLEAVYVGLVIYVAGRLALAWVWIPVTTSGGSPIGPIVYMWFLGPAAFILASAAFRALVRRVQARDVAATLRADQRRQVLYLRSFGDDRFEVPVHASVFESVGQLFDWSRKLSFEEVLVRRLWRYGPVLAVGRPGERRAPLGAARLYYPEDDWQGPVREWVSSSSLVVVTMGKTRSLGWELQMLRENRALRKTIVVIPPTNDSTARTALLADELGLRGPWTEYDGIRMPLAFTFDDLGHAHPVYGDVFDDVAYELALDYAVPFAFEASPARQARA